MRRQESSRPVCARQFVKVTRTGGHKFKAKMRDIQTPIGIRGYRVGWAVDEFYQKDGKVISVSAVAKINEFGAPSEANGIKAPRRGTIPERPFFRLANDAFYKDIKMLIPILAGRKGRLSIRNIHTLAKYHVNAVKKSIRTGTFAPNTKGTRLRKGWGKPPLTDTGKMAETVDYDFIK